MAEKTKKITAKINGEEKSFADETSLADLIEIYDLDIKKIAFERNLEIILPEDLAKNILEEGDNIEIVHFIGGG